MAPRILPDGSIEHPSTDKDAIRARVAARCAAPEEEDIKARAGRRCRPRQPHQATVRVKLSFWYKKPSCSVYFYLNLVYFDAGLC